MKLLTYLSASFLLFLSQSVAAQTFSPRSIPQRRVIPVKPGLPTPSNDPRQRHQPSQAPRLTPIFPRLAPAPKPRTLKPKVSEPTKKQRSLPIKKPTSLLEDHAPSITPASPAPAKSSLESDRESSNRIFQEQPAQESLVFIRQKPQEPALNLNLDPRFLDRREAKSPQEPFESIPVHLQADPRHLAPSASQLSGQALADCDISQWPKVWAAADPTDPASQRYLVAFEPPKNPSSRRITMLVTQFDQRNPEMFRFTAIPAIPIEDSKGEGFRKYLRSLDQAVWSPWAEKK